MLRGCDFTSQDTLAAPQVIIINQTLARRYFANEDPIGKRITLDFVPDEKPRQVIAVVGDIVLNRLQPKELSEVYVPYTQQTPRWIGPYWSDRAGMFFILRTAGKPESIVPSLRRAVAEVDPNKPAGNVRTVEKLSRSPGPVSPALHPAARNLRRRRRRARRDRHLWRDGVLRC